MRDTDARLTLYLRHARRLPNPNPDRVRIVNGDVLDRPTLETAMRGQDVVYANLAGDTKKRAEHIIAAAVIEASDLDYTILRPGWFTRDEEVA